MKIPKRKEQIRLGTRSSLLALQQANWVRSRIEERHPEFEVQLVHIKTEGDRIDVPLFQVGGKGLFVKEIEEALLAGKVDLAVHSAKDLPTAIPQGLELMAFPEREDPRDVLISARGKGWRELPVNGKVGTGSLRRQAQLLHLRPDLEILPLRGNLDTRIKKLTALNLDAIMVAAAGLHRMGWGEKITEYLEDEDFLPAAGQGALALEAREDDQRIRQALVFLNHPPTAAAVAAERAFLGRLEGGCQIPVAGLARAEGERLLMSGLVASVDGRTVIRGEIRGTPGQSDLLGKKLAEELLARGAGEILREVCREK
jgi:hydroxymethylbilane synthase